MQLTTKQCQQFDEQGYLRIENAIDPTQLAQLKDQADKVQQWGFTALKRNQVPSDFAFKHHFFLPYLNRITQFHLYAGSDSLAILGSPTVLDIAQSLCGKTFLPTVDMLILKNQHDGLDLPWHQDLIFDGSKHRVIALGIYLEDSHPGDGALKLIKGSHSARQDIDKLMKDSAAQVVEVTANAADIVVHNPMLVHWSDKLENQTHRRTLYYEFRPINQVQHDENWPPSVITQRLSLLAKALTEYQRQHPEKQQFSVQHGENWPVVDSVCHLPDLYRERIPFANANFAKALTQKLTKKLD